jgi:RNA polymerase sigma-70 factor (ECF subfamily)
MMMVDRDVQLAAAGDIDAFEQIYRRYHRRVYSICRRMTRTTSEAEDLTQDVFVQLFRKIGTFRGEASFATWLHRLTVNEVLMHFRKPAVRNEETTGDGSTPVQTDGFKNNVSLIDRLSLVEAMRQLSPGYRMVFMLHDVEGYKHQQIGQMLGCASGTSKSQLHKARMKLRHLLGKRSTVRQAPLNPALQISHLGD